MDDNIQEHYDVVGARAYLKALQEESMGGKQFSRQLAAYAKDSGPELFCIQYEDGQGTRLAVKNTNDGGMEEAVLRVQGIICKSHLPPKRKLLRLVGVLLLDYLQVTYRVASGEPDGVRYMQQSFTLIGCESGTFDMAVEGAFSIAEFLSRQDSDMAPWRPTIIGTSIALEASNRLFVKQTKQMEHVPVAMDKTVDPHGTLQKMANGQYVHSEDCVVRYFKRESKDGNTSYNKADSGMFKVGDIVEAQCSFIVIPTRSGQHTMKIILRAMTMLNSDFSKTARLALWKANTLTTQTATEPSNKRIHLRTVGYDADVEVEDEVDYVNKRVKTMQVDS
ncbi:hypothetical protein HWV62_8813 [Athelia sp. TMB]|nr:hypothetical protein HWV62_8813 [Athelia sp. TMB]